MRALLVLAATALLPACDLDADAEESEPLNLGLERREATRVRTTPLVVEEMVRVLSTTTTVESEREIEVYPRVSGVVDEVRVEEGGRVERAQVLAVLDQREARASLEDAKLALKEARDLVRRLEIQVEEALERARSAQLAFEQARAEYERNLEARLISDLDLEKLKLTRDTTERTWKAAELTHQLAQRDLEQQELVIERAELTVEREELTVSFTEITAPFDGVVAARMVRVGDTVTTGEPVFTLTDPEELRCVVPRPQRELGFFQATGVEGHEVEIRVRPEAFPDHEYAGEIEIVSPTIDRESGSFRLTIGLEQPPPGADRPRLLPGMLVRLSIVTERHPEALVVPKRALRREGDRHFLYLDRGGVAERVEVDEGLSDDERVEVLPTEGTDLEVGARVVVVGNRELEDGEAVEAEAWEGDGAASPSGGEDEVAAAAEDESSSEDGDPDGAN